jgi:octaheme c-type cytochrome (tetrathionate reductase family)
MAISPTPIFARFFTHFGRSAAVLFLLAASLIGQQGSTADHTKFEELQGPFTDGPSVTRACLQCHTEAAAEFMKTRHWTWYSEVESLAGEDGKRNLVGKGGSVINNFCIAVASNEPRCTSCHAGYGWKDKEFDFAEEARVDCLICHEQTGTYKKYPTDAGHPVYEAKEWPKGSGKLWQPPDLAVVAQSVGTPTAENCGSCHFSGGGGEGVKHGDMDGSLINAPREHDVHLSPEGGDFNCTRCHTTEHHEIAGPVATLAARDKHEFLVAGEEGDRLACESCHTARPHAFDMDKGADPNASFLATKLDDHSDKVACQTCHVPTFARTKPTKMWWDWSTAGDKVDGKPRVSKTEVKGVPVMDYHGMKGDFIWALDVAPEYRWYNGKAGQAFIGDAVDDSTPGSETTSRGAFDHLDLAQPVVAINRPEGSYADANARIWPFKIHRGKQLYDPVTRKLIVPKLFGPKESGAYWTNYDWDLAAAKGMEYVGEEWSGESDWIQTEMFWPLTHMVAPKEQALDCVACHAPEGRLSTLTDFYLPGRDRNTWVDLLGWLAVGGAAVGTMGHLALRLAFKRKRERKQSEGGAK